MHRTPIAALLCYMFTGLWLIAATYLWSSDQSLAAAGGLGAAIPFYLGGQIIDWLARQHEATQAGNAAVGALAQEVRTLVAVQRSLAAREEVRDIAASIRPPSP